jgi:lipopolysaccharide export system permease protein
MLATLGMTVLVFTLVLMLGNFIKELLQLIIHRQATVGLMFHAVALLLPYVLGFSLPIGMLTAALLVFGRFSADQELTAARASGISLLSLISPVLVLSVLVSALCAWLNLDLGPASRMAFKDLLYQAGVNRPANFLQSNEATPVGNYTIYVGKVHPDGTNLDTVIVTEYDKAGQLQATEAASGTVISDLAAHRLILNLEDQHTMYRFSDGWRPLMGSPTATFQIEIKPEEQKVVPLPISDMTFRQLLDKRDDIERRMAGPAAPGKTKTEILDTRRELRSMTVDMMTPVLVYLHREAAFSFACIGFTMIGIPLGIRGHRRETSAGVAMALVLMLIYYSFIVLGQAWADHAERAPYLIVWLPNFIFQAAGAVLLWKANRGI